MDKKYPLLRPNEIISALTKIGFTFVRQKGSHAKYSKGHKTEVIPMHDIVARGTLKSILLQAGIKLDDFLKLL